MVRVRPLKCWRAALRLKAYVPAPPAPMAAPFLPPMSPPTAAPPAIIAAVRALRPKRERLLVCADASSDRLVIRNNKQSRLTETFRMFKLLPLLLSNTDENGRARSRAYFCKHHSPSDARLKLKKIAPIKARATPTPSAFER